MSFHFSIEDAKNGLAEVAPIPFVQLLQYGTMIVEYYAPKGSDLQTPHKQDELYVIAEGTGELNRAGEIVVCKKGDMLFVPAGMEHRFQNFTDDFGTWVIFYGKEGGEVSI